jgi:4'-phosphopantetheinyl transferase
MLDVGRASIRNAWDMLDAEERRRSERYVMDTDRQAFVVTRAALRVALASMTGGDPKTIRFEVGRWGKPSVSAPVLRVPLNFSISHSGSLSVIAVAFGGRVGIDVEQRRRVADAPTIASGCMGQEVAALLTELDGEVQDRAFLKLWTAAESLAKATGLGWEGHGGCIPMQASNHDLADAKFAVPPASAPGHEWSIKWLDVGPHHVGALVIESAEGELIPEASLRPATLELTNAI